MNIKRSVQLTWNRTRNMKTASLVRTGSTGSMITTHVLECVHETVSGNVEVTIELDEIVARVARRAVNTRSGKATLLERMVRAKKVTERVERSTTETHPIPSGYTVVSEVLE